MDSISRIERPLWCQKCWKTGMTGEWEHQSRCAWETLRLPLRLLRSKLKYQSTESGSFSCGDSPRESNHDCNAIALKKITRMNFVSVIDWHRRHYSLSDRDGAPLSQRCRCTVSSLSTVSPPPTEPSNLLLSLPWASVGCVHLNMELKPTQTLIFRDLCINL